jgi:serine/threonine-protein kinase
MPAGRGENQSPQGPSDDPTLDMTSAMGTGASGRSSGTTRDASGAMVAALSPGLVLLDRYRLVVRIGRGGMGEVYRADDLELGQSVALKFLPAEVAADAARLAMLRAEVAAARQVAHPNVCRVFDIARTDLAGGPLAFLCMEYIDGSDLSSLLERIGRFPSEKAAEIGRQVCFGLAAVHDAGFVDRDLKPSNVLLDGRGKARLADFGLASPHAAESMNLAGTPRYMAPELLDGERATRQSDIYALGLVLYELFTGRCARPEVASIDDLRKRIATPEFEPARPSSYVADLPQGVEQVILECLSHDPSLRPRSAVAVAARLPGGDPLAAALAAGETPRAVVAARDDHVDATPRGARAGPRSRARRASGRVAGNVRDVTGGRRVRRRAADRGPARAPACGGG